MAEASVEAVKEDKSFPEGGDVGAPRAARGPEAAARSSSVGAAAPAASTPSLAAAFDGDTTKPPTSASANGTGVARGARRRHGSTPRGDDASGKGSHVSGASGDDRDALRRAFLDANAQQGGAAASGADSAVALRAGGDGSGGLSALQLLQQQRTILQNLCTVESKWAEERAILEQRFAEERDNWEQDRSFLEDRLTATTAVFKKASVQHVKDKQKLEACMQALKETRETNRFLRARLTQSLLDFDGVAWGDLRWGTAKLMPPGSKSLSAAAFLHVLLCGVVAMALFYMMGHVNRPNRVAALSEWTIGGEALADGRLWNISAEGIVHFHAPLVLLALLAAEVCFAAWTGKLRRRAGSVVQCALSSAVFFLLLSYWLSATVSDGTLGQGRSIEVADGAEYSAAAATITAATQGGALPDGTTPSPFWEAALLVAASPALWLVILLPPPAFILLRLLIFRRVSSLSTLGQVGSADGDSGFDSESDTEAAAGGGQKPTWRFVLETTGAVIAWLANAVVVSGGLLLTSQTLTALSCPTDMEAVLVWSVLPNGDFYQWSLNTHTLVLFYAPAAIAGSVLVMRTLLVFALREHPTAWVQRTALDLAFVGGIWAWAQFVLGIDVAFSQAVTCPLIGCTAVCLSRAIVAFHVRFWRTSVKPADGSGPRADAKVDSAAERVAT